MTRESLQAHHEAEWNRVLSKPLDAPAGSVGLGKRLKYARALRRAGAAFIEKIGVARQTVSMIEQGRRAPRLDLLEQLANGLDVRVEWLAHGTGEMEKKGQS